MNLQQQRVQMQQTRQQGMLQRDAQGHEQEQPSPQQQPPPPPNTWHKVQDTGHVSQIYGVAYCSRIVFQLSLDLFNKDS